MAHALSGTRRDGTPLPELADFDHDGTFGLLDAHTWARIEANSFDVPTTTSERWLERHASPGRTAIEQLLSSSPEAQARTASKERRRVLNEQLNRAWVTEARVFRVVRAYESLHRAAALMKSGGAAARYYQTLLACERAGL
jgi:hypothetical protein